MSHPATAATVHDPGNDAWEAVITRIQRPAFLIGAIGLLVALIGLFVTPEAGFRSYLWAFVYWTAIPLGSLAFLMIQHMTGGTWGLLMRRFLEASASLIVLSAVLSIPLILAVVTKRYTLYPWIDVPNVHARELGHHVNEAHIVFKQMWLSPGTWIFRTIAYFCVWSFLALSLYSWSGREDRDGWTPRFAFRARVIAAPGILLFALCLTFAYIDWVMSLDPAWYSTMFGVLYLIGSGLETMAFTIVMIRLLADRRPLRDVINPGVLNDVGNLTFAFTMLWAYVNFSQLLIMWSGNIAEETPYYYVRSSKGWLAITIFLAVFHFFVPFMLLLWRKIKRDIRLLALVAFGILVVRAVDSFWVIKPMFIQREITLNRLTHETEGGVSHSAPALDTGGTEHPAPGGAEREHEHGETMRPSGGVPTSTDLPRDKYHVDVDGVWKSGVHWTDPFAIAGVGGIFIAAFAWRLKQRPLLPPNDPRLAALAADGHH